MLANGLDGLVEQHGTLVQLEAEYPPRSARSRMSLAVTDPNRVPSSLARALKVQGQALRACDACRLASR